MSPVKPISEVLLEALDALASSILEIDPPPIQAVWDLVTRIRTDYAKARDYRCLHDRLSDGLMIEGESALSPTPRDPEEDFTTERLLPISLTVRNSRSEQLTTDRRMTADNYRLFPFLRWLEKESLIADTLLPPTTPQHIAKELRHWQTKTGSSVCSFCCLLDTSHTP